jgi:hypothetical protein
MMKEMSGYEFYSYFVNPIETDSQCVAKMAYSTKSALINCPIHATKTECNADAECNYNEPYPGNNKYFSQQTFGPTSGKKTSTNEGSFEYFTKKECNNFCAKENQCFGIYYI